MEGFTLVLLISWLALLGSFAAMYYMDRAVKEAETRKSSAASEASRKQAG